MTLFSRSRLHHSLTRHRMYLVRDPLVSLFGTDRFDRIRQSRRYRFFVEAFTMNVFSIVISTPNELLVAGMDFGEFIGTRLAAVVFNTLTGRMYGVWRDWLLRKLGIDQKSRFYKKYAADTIAFVSFQLPGYWMCCLLGGAEFNEAIRASVILTIIAGLTGGPYGVWLEKVRVECGLSALGGVETRIS